MLRIQVVTLVALAVLRDRLRDDERGEVTSTTIMIAVLATLALAVGVILTAKVTSKANSIPTD